MKTLAAFALVLGLGTTVPVGAAVLIEVDVSNPAAVTFTATGNASQVNDSSATLYDGVDLLQFFTSEGPIFSSSFLGNLTPRSSTPGSFTTKEPDTYPSVRTALAIYHNGTYQNATEDFSTAAPAFSGIGLADFSTAVAFLPAAGATGDIIAGWSAGGSKAVIGQWTVVPEPSMLVLGGIGASMVLLRRRNSIA